MGSRGSIRPTEAHPRRAGEQGIRIEISQIVRDVELAAQIALEDVGETTLHGPERREYDSSGIDPSDDGNDFGDRLLKGLLGDGMTHQRGDAALPA